MAGAVGICRGELLAGMDDGWVHDVRGAHNAQVQQALATLAAGAAAAGDAQGAVAGPGGAAALDPLDEPRSGC